MKKLFTIFGLTFLFCFFQIASAADTTISSPINPAQIIHGFKIGIFGGVNIPISPKIMINSPSVATDSVQRSLMNGLDGLGYGTTYNLGLTAKYPLYEKFYLGANLSYTGWKSKSECQCGADSGSSENALSMFHFAIVPQYYFFMNFYAAPEISFNFFNAKVTENSIRRGKLDFNKSYTRIGAGLGVGYELPLTKRFSLDLSAKGQFPNLLMGKDNTGVDLNKNDSESLINQKDEAKEAMLFIFSLNLGVLFAL